MTPAETSAGAAAGATPTTPAESSAGAEARARIRAGFTGPTSGMAPGLVQANLIAVPADWAFDVLLFAQRNPKPCPVIDVLEPGRVESALAAGSDLRTDLPRYRVWEDGQLTAEVDDASSVFADHPRDPHGYINHAETLGDTRLIYLDTCAPQTHAGHFGADRLAWLAGKGLVQKPLAR